VNRKEKERFNYPYEKLSRNGWGELEGYMIWIIVLRPLHIPPPNPINYPIFKGLYYLTGVVSDTRRKLGRDICWRWETLCYWWVIILWPADRKREGYGHE
jgi:hypothetical protein